MKKFFALILAAVIFIVPASATIKLVGIEGTSVTTITPAIQEESKWCWAACAKMAGEFRYYWNNNRQWPNISQTEIVTEVFGSPVNNTASIVQTNQATKYVFNNRNTSGDGTNYSTSVFSYSEIVSHINNNKPIVAALDSAIGMNVGHMVVIFGYEYTDSEETLYILDPITGIAYNVVFEDFKVGTIWLNQQQYPTAYFKYVKNVYFTR